MGGGEQEGNGILVTWSQPEGTENKGWGRRWRRTENNDSYACKWRNETIALPAHVKGLILEKCRAGTEYPVDGKSILKLWFGKWIVKTRTVVRPVPAPWRCTSLLRLCWVSLLEARASHLLSDRCAAKQCFTWHSLQADLPKPLSHFIQVSRTFSPLRVTMLGLVPLPLSSRTLRQRQADLYEASLIHSEF